MTLDELSIRIVVAAEEADAALDGLLEKTRKLAQSGLLSLRLEKTEAQNSLKEALEELRQTAAEGGESVGKEIAARLESAMSELPGAVEENAAVFQELASGLTAAKESAQSAAEMLEACGQADAQSFGQWGEQAESVRSGFEECGETLQNVLQQLSGLAAQRQTIQTLKSLQTEMKSCEKGSATYQRKLEQARAALEAAGLSTRKASGEIREMEEAIGNAENGSRASAQGIADSLNGVIAWAKRTRESMQVRGNVQVDVNPAIVALNAMISVALKALSVLQRLGLSKGAGSPEGTGATSGGGGGGGNSAEEAARLAEEARKKALEADYERLEHRRRLNEVSLEEELAGLEEIRRKHRMTAEEIMSWEEKVYDLKKEIRERDAESIDQLGDGVVSALEKRYEAMRDAELERLDKSREAWEQWRDDSVQAVEEQIAALERLSEGEDEEKKSAEELRKIEKLRQEAAYEQDEYNRKKLQQQLEEARESREERLRKLELKRRKEALQEEIEQIREQASEKIRELDGEQEAVEKVYEERLKSASLQAEAEKLLTTKTQDEIVRLLYEYVPEYDALGKSMGEKLLEGFQSRVGNLADWFRDFNDQLARMQDNLARDMNAATDRFYQERQAQGQNAGATVNQTVNFYEPVESPSQVARRMEDVNDRLGMMMA